MRRPRLTPSVRVRVVRSILAAALACLVMAASVPSEAVSIKHGCSMPCCKGKIGGTAGHGDGESCHVKLSPPAPTPEPVVAEPLCGGSPAPASHDEVSSELKDPAEHDAPHADVEGGIEHDGHADVSSGDAAPRAPAVSASVSKPCPPDCGALPNSFSQLRRPRDGAALAYGLKPRPPTVAALRRDRAGASKTSTELRSQSAPRAPPSTSPAV
jgi:hypothetical protein